MRHLGRVHRISIAWLHERYQDPYVRLKYTTSEAMAADIFTKAFKEANTWNKLLGLIGIVSPSRIKDFLSADPLKCEADVEFKDDSPAPCAACVEESEEMAEVRTVTL